MCELTGADQRKPLGIISSFKVRMYPSWPSVHLQGNTEVRYKGPLPPSCQCLPTHPPFRGFNEHEEFRSSHSPAFGKQFWWYTVASLLQFPGHSVLRNEALSSSRPSSFSPGLHGFSLASSSGSKSQLHVAWYSGKLTKSILEHCGGNAAASRYFAGKVSLLVLPGCRSTSSPPISLLRSSATSTGSLQVSSSSCGPLRAPGDAATEGRCFPWL